MEKDNKIGILNEHTLHLALKKYIEPDVSFHERKVGRFVADIKRGNEIFEIETRSFSNVKRKLDEFLKDNVVTVVYPVAKIKWVVWIDPETGELSKKHKSPKKGRACDVIPELYKLKKYICNEKFRLKIVMAEIVDYKRKDGWSYDGKRGATREERVPINYFEVFDINSSHDYSILFDVVPDGEFTASEFAKMNKMTRMHTWSAIQIMLEACIIERIGKNGREYIYRRL